MRLEFESFYHADWGYIPRSLLLTWLFFFKLCLLSSLIKNPLPTTPPVDSFRHPRRKSSRRHGRSADGRSNFRVQGGFQPLRQGWRWSDLSSSSPSLSILRSRFSRSKTSIRRAIASGRPAVVLFLLRVIGVLCAFFALLPRSCVVCVCSTQADILVLMSAMFDDDC